MDTDVAVKAGRMAARMGKPLSSCPYDPDAGGRQAVMALGFVRGWRAGQAGTDAHALLAAFDGSNGPDPSRADIAAWARAAGADTHPGDGKLKAYWTKGEGLAKWINEEHRWTALYHHLKKQMPDELARRTAAQWFHDVTGIWPGHQKGSDPNGPG